MRLARIESSTEVREWSADMSRGPFRGRGFHAAGNQHSERIARTSRADRDFHGREAGFFEQRLQGIVIEPEPFVAETLPNPALVMPAELEKQHASTGADDP